MKQRSTVTLVVAAINFFTASAQKTRLMEAAGIA